MTKELTRGCKDFLSYMYYKSHMMYYYPSEPLLSYSNWFNSWDPRHSGDSCYD